MSSYSQNATLANEPIAARSGTNNSAKWGAVKKIAIGILCVALLAAGIAGLAIGLSRRDKGDSTSAVTNTAGTTATASRDAGTSTATTAGSESTTNTGSTSGAAESTGTTGSENSCADGDMTCSSGAEAEETATCGSVLDVATATPELSTLVAAIEAAGLAETVSDDEAVITVLAPSNSAFAKIPQEQLDSILADKTRLASILNMHISTAAAVPTTSMGDGRQLATNAGFLNVTASGGSVTFTTSDGASSGTVTTGNVETCKGYVHIIDSVLASADLLGSASGPASAEAPASATATTGTGTTTPGTTTPVTIVPGETVAVKNPLVTLTRNEEGKYAVCAGRWAPKEFTGPEPCGIRVRTTGVVELGSQFGGDNGYFSIDASDGLDDGCFKASIAAMFQQKLCATSKVIGGTKCIAEADGADCVCIAPFGEPEVLELNRKWDGNVDINRFLKILQSRSKIEESGDRQENLEKAEATLMDILTVMDC